MKGNICCTLNYPAELKKCCQVCDVFDSCLCIRNITKSIFCKIKEHQLLCMHRHRLVCHRHKQHLSGCYVPLRYGSFCLWCVCLTKTKRVCNIFIQTGSRKHNFYITAGAVTDNKEFVLFGKFFEMFLQLHRIQDKVLLQAVDFHIQSINLQGVCVLLKEA